MFPLTDLARFVSSTRRHNKTPKKGDNCEIEIPMVTVFHQETGPQLRLYAYSKTRHADMLTMRRADLRAPCHIRAAPTYLPCFPWAVAHTALHAPSTRRAIRLSFVAWLHAPQQAHTAATDCVAHEPHEPHASRKALTSAYTSAGSRFPSIVLEIEPKTRSTLSAEPCGAEPSRAEPAEPSQTELSRAELS